MQDRSHAAAVLVADRVQHEPFVRVHRDPQRPALPLHEVAVDREARPLGLGDLERLEVVAHRTDVVAQVAAALGRQWHDAVVDDLQDLSPSVVDERDEPFDWPGVAVVGVGLPVVREAAADAASLFVREPEVPGRPRVDLGPGQIGDAAAGEGRLPLGVLVQRHDRVEALPVQQGRAHARHLAPRRDGAAADVDDGLHHVGRRSGHDHDANPPVDRVAGGEPRDRVLGGLVEPEVGEEGGIGHAAVGPQHVPGRLDLGRVERVQRMGGASTRSRWCRVDRHARPSPCWAQITV